MRKILVFVSAVTLCLSLTGCGKTTPQSILEDVDKKMEKTASCNMDLDFDAKIDIDLKQFFSELIEETEEMQEAEESNISTTAFTLNGALNSVINKTEDNSLTKLDGTITCELFDFEGDKNVISYQEIKDGSVITYSCDEESGKWTKTESEKSFSVEDIIDYLSKKKDLTLKKGTEKVNGQECYILKGTFTSEELKNLIDKLDKVESSSATELAKSMKFPNFDFTLYVGKKTKLPAKFEIKIDGSEDINSVTANMTAEFSAWDSAKDVVIPEAAKKAKAEEGNVSGDELEGILNELPVEDGENVIISGDGN